MMTRRGLIRGWIVVQASGGCSGSPPSSEAADDAILVRRVRSRDGRLFPIRIVVLQIEPLPPSSSRGAVAVRPPTSEDESGGRATPLRLEFVLEAIVAFLFPDVVPVSASAAAVEDVPDGAEDEEQGCDAAEDTAEDCGERFGGA